MQCHNWDVVFITHSSKQVIPRWQWREQKLPKPPHTGAHTFVCTCKIPSLQVKSSNLPFNPSPGEGTRFHSRVIFITSTGWILWMEQLLPFTCTLLLIPREGGRTRSFPYSTALHCPPDQHLMTHSVLSLPPKGSRNQYFPSQNF